MRKTYLVTYTYEDPKHIAVVAADPTEVKAIVKDSFGITKNYNKIEEITTSRVVLADFR